MLWRQIKRVVTGQGCELAGAAVRDWLRSKGAIPNVSPGDVASVETDATDTSIVLRTEAEFAAWLREVHGCSEVEIADEVGTSNQRPAARGQAHTNANDTPLKLEFFDTRQGKPIETLEVTQGLANLTKIELRLNAPKTEPNVELAFIGAKLRVRPAIRSAISGPGPAITPRYSYLSRVRLAGDGDGIGKPLRDLNTSFRSISCRAGKWDGARRKLVLETFTVVGLEWGHGEELLQACLLSPRRAVLCTALLRIKVGKPLPVNAGDETSCWVGAYRVLANTCGDDFLNRLDQEFRSIYAVSGTKAGEARIGICDSGIVDDGSSSYLSSRTVWGKYFDTVAPLSKQNPDLARNDRDTKTGGRDRANQPVHMLKQYPGKHGTNVAGQAAWGTPEIKLLDIMVQAGQTMGAMTEDTANRAFGEAAKDAELCVVNCSKIMPFQKDKTNEVVVKAENQVLFLASGGNKGFSFPVNSGELEDSQFSDARMRPDPGRDDFPRNFINTLWVGGCKRDRTPHPERGCGPAIDVLVPADAMTLYTPLSLMESAAAGTMEKFKEALLSGLRGDKAGLPPNTLNMRDRGIMANLVAKESEAATSGDPAAFGAAERFELQQLRQRAAAPNPLGARYDAVYAQIDGLSIADAVAWLKGVEDIAAALPRTEATLRNSIDARIRNHALTPGPVRDKLRDARLAANDVASDEGVSFGLPIVANVAAKLKLIRKSLKPEQMRRILIDTSDYDPGFENLSISRGMLNPLRAYFAAFDNEISTGGRDPREYKTREDASLNDRRRLYYTLFHMGSDALRLFDSIRGRLVAAFREVNIDLVEAESPLQLPDEPYTYVDGPSIDGYNWTQVVPVKRHPLLYREKHVRLILVNQCAVPQGNKMAGTVLERTVKCVQPPTVPGQRQPPLTWIIQNPVGSAVIVTPGKWHADQWTCELATPAGTRFVFPKRTEHIAPQISYNGEPVDPATVKVVRDGDQKATITIGLPLASPPAADYEVTLQVGVLQLIGGSRNGRDIFINKAYHAGPAGTPDADASALVLFMHEIGHALGMTPPSHERFYNKASGGGDGDHCFTNAELIPHSRLHEYGDIPGDSGAGSVFVPTILITGGGRPQCVMYHTRTKVHHKATKFCDACQGWLKGADLEGKWTFPMG